MFVPRSLQAKWDEYVGIIRIIGDMGKDWSCLWGATSGRAP